VQEDEEGQLEKRGIREWGGKRKAGTFNKARKTTTTSTNF